MMAPQPHVGEGGGAAGRATAASGRRGQASACRLGRPGPPGSRGLPRSGSLESSALRHTHSRTGGAQKRRRPGLGAAGRHAEASACGPAQARPVGVRAARWMALVKLAKALTWKVGGVLIYFWLTLEPDGMI